MKKTRDMGRHGCVIEGPGDAGLGNKICPVINLGGVAIVAPWKSHRSTVKIFGYIGVIHSSGAAALIG